MKLSIAALLALASFAYAEYAVPLESNTAYGYLTRFGIPEAERIRKAEEKYISESRIVGGVPAAPGQYAYQVRATRFLDELLDHHGYE